MYKIINNKKSTGFSGAFKTDMRNNTLPKSLELYILLQVF